MPPVVFPPIATPYIPTYPVSLPPSDSGGTGIASTGGGQGTSSGTVNVYNPPIALPIASFTYRVYAGGLVAFTNTSLNNPTIFLWNFGDGSTSTAKNPFHLYTSAGTKTITLTVQNSGGTNSSSQSINITILAEAANYTYVASGLKVFFTDTSTALGRTFLWDFGDSSASTEQNPIHTYAVAGDYTVKLIVNGIYEHEEAVSVAASDSDIVDEDMEDINDWDDLDVEPAVSSQVTFDDKSCMKLDSGATLDKIAARGRDIGTFDTRTVFYMSIYCDAIGTQTNWDVLFFQAYDGSNCFYVIFASDGLFVVSGGAAHEIGTDLVIQDVWQEWIFDVNWTTKTVDIYLDKILKASGISCSVPNGAVSNGNCYFEQKNKTTANQISYIDWFKAGSSLVFDANCPIASFTTDVNSGIAPLTVTFTDTSTGTPETWLWEFGDGSTSTSQNPSHIFTTKGNYTVRLTATNAYGNTSYVKTIQINSVQIELTTLPPIASFTADAKIIVPGTTVNFTDTSTGGTATSWSWKANGVGFATTQNASHLFTDAGIYIIIFTVTDAGGLSSTTMQTIVVTSDIDPSDNIPLAKITPDKTSGFAPTTINFSATVSTPDIFYLWDFGDGSTSPSASVSHTYMKGGIYTVTLTVSNIYGSTVTTMTIVMADVRYADLSIVGYYIIDRVNNRILIYGKTGTLLSSFGGKGSQVGKFNMPTCLLINK